MAVTCKRIENWIVNFLKRLCIESVHSLVVLTENWKLNWPISKMTLYWIDSSSTTPTWWIELQYNCIEFWIETVGFFSLSEPLRALVFIDRIVYRQIFLMLPPSKLVWRLAKPTQDVVVVFNLLVAKATWLQISSFLLLQITGMPTLFNS